MSKSNKNQKSITSFFKNPAQTAANEPAAPKPKPPPPIVATKEIKKENVAIDLPSSSSSEPATASVIQPTKPVAAPTKPTVITCPTISKEPTHETEWFNLSDRFLLKNRNFEVQYAHLYAERLGSMRKSVTQAAENRWG